MLWPHLEIQLLKTTMSLWLLQKPKHKHGKGRWGGLVKIMLSFAMLLLKNDRAKRYHKSSFFNIQFRLVRVGSHLQVLKCMA
jgi:hypothetical protein